jgi:hypothetical protein
MKGDPIADDDEVVEKVEACRFSTCRSLLKVGVVSDPNEGAASPDDDGQ